MWAWDQRWRKEDKWFGSYSKWLKWQVMWLIWKFLLLWVIFVVAKMNSKNATLYVKSYSRQIQSSNNMLKCSTLGEVWNQIFVTSAKYQNQCIVKNLQYSIFLFQHVRKQKSHKNQFCSSKSPIWKVRKIHIIENIEE